MNKTYFVRLFMWLVSHSADATALFSKIEDFTEADGIPARWETFKAIGDLIVSWEGDFPRPDPTAFSAQVDNTTLEEDCKAAYMRHLQEHLTAHPGAARMDFASMWDIFTKYVLPILIDTLLKK